MSKKRAQADPDAVRWQLLLEHAKTFKASNAPAQVVSLMTELVNLWTAAATLLAHRGYMFIPRDAVDLFERQLRVVLGRWLPKEVLATLEGYDV